MLILLSPAKTTTGASKIKAPQGTTLRFQQETSEIALHMAQFPIDELSHVLKLSPRLVAECYRRYQDLHAEDKQPLQAILTYTDIVFENINPKDSTEKDFLFPQEHMRFVSGCYRLLRPLDLIKSYRIGSDIKIPELGGGNIYASWKDRQTDTLVHDARQGDKILLNLASLDIQPSLQWKGAEQSVRIITSELKVWRNDKAKTIVIYAKVCRGQMSRYLIKNRISDLEALKVFTWEGSSYKESMSEGDNWVFLQG